MEADLNVSFQSFEIKHRFYVDEMIGGVTREKSVVSPDDIFDKKINNN